MVPWVVPWVVPWLSRLVVSWLSRGCPGVPAGPDPVSGLSRLVVCSGLSRGCLPRVVCLGLSPGCLVVVSWLFRGCFVLVSCVGACVVRPTRLLWPGLTVRPDVCICVSSPLPFSALHRRVSPLFPVSALHRRAPQLGTESVAVRRQALPARCFVAFPRSRNTNGCHERQTLRGGAVRRKALPAQRVRSEKMKSRPSKLARIICNLRLELRKGITRARRPRRLTRAEIRHREKSYATY